MTDTLARPVPIDRNVPQILEAAQIVMDRLGHDNLSLAQVAKVSLIPLARIYQYFADKNAVLGALSSRALARLAGSIDARGQWAGDLDEAARIDRVVERCAAFLESPTAAYLVLCGPFDSASEHARLEAAHRLGLAIHHALAPDHSAGEKQRSVESLDYAAEAALACLRRGYLIDGRVTRTAIDMATHAVRAFVAA